MPFLTAHGALTLFTVYALFGRKIRPQFEGEVVTDVSDLSFKRIVRSLIKHRVKQNWLKMYDKGGSVLCCRLIPKLLCETRRRYRQRIFRTYLKLEGL